MSKTLNKKTEIINLLNERYGKQKVGLVYTWESLDINRPYRFGIVLSDKLRFYHTNNENPLIWIFGRSNLRELYDIIPLLDEDEQEFFLFNLDILSYSE